ncbi:MAG: hypothetical protein HOJ95_16425 [Nitrospinaceae bacterium]|nr:hypothetical protein [Nitrospinaceae bacterium]
MMGSRFYLLAIAIVVEVAVARAGALDRAVASGGAVAGALAVAVAVASASASYFKTGIMDDYSITVVLFLVVLPFLNGAWDWFSLSVSRCLGEDILKRRSGLRALGLALLDVAAAVFFLFTLAAVLILGIETLVYFAEWDFNLQDFLIVAATDPWGQGFWVSFMLLSTLVPTAAHFAVVLFGVVPSLGWGFRGTLTEKINGTESRYLLPAVYFAFWGIASVAMVIAGFWVVFWGIGKSGYPVSQMLLDYANWILDLIGS